ncbi:MAG: uroporphyrinogen decarboxylase family protein [Thermotogota bacterium]|nr:uroporphyrinogen decarboxylase family protein [Thermotogota bacterium]
MTSRERVLTTLNHKEPDRVPIDLGGMRSTGIHAIAYKNLKEFLNCMNKEIKIYDIYQQLALVENDIRERVHGDVVELKRLDGGFGTKINGWKRFQMFPDGGEYYVPKDFYPEVESDGSLIIKNNNKVVATMPKGGYYFDGCYFPLSGVKEKAEIDKTLDEYINDEELDFLEVQAKEIRENTDCAIMGSFGGNFLEAGHGYFGYQEFMERIITDKTLIEYFLNKLEEKYLHDLEKYLNRVGKYLDIIVLGDDYGTQENSQISPKMFREMFKPHMKTLCDFIKHKNKNVRIFLHSCGSVIKLIPDFIDAGIEILNPVQTNARGMDPEVLKKKFGEDLTFWGGGCDTQHILPFGTLDELKDDIRKREDIFAPGGGFVFSAIHNVQKEVTPQKIVLLYDSAYDFGFYRK